MVLIYSKFKHLYGFAYFKVNNNLYAFEIYTKKYILKHLYGFKIL